MGKVIRNRSAYTEHESIEIPEITELDEAFLNRKTVEILTSLTGDSSYAQEVSRNVDFTYRVFQRREDHGLARGEIEGRNKNYKLTEEGQDGDAAFDATLLDD